LNYYIKRIILKKIYGIFNLDIELSPGINILYGVNGSGKTTLIHLLANILDMNFYRFAFIDFELIEVILSNNCRIILKKSKSKIPEIDVNINGKSIIIFPVIISDRNEEKYYYLFRNSEILNIRCLSHYKVGYFPAFRNIIEAWKAENIDKKRLLFRGITDQFEEELVTTKERINVFEGNQELTRFVRTLFGDFIPFLNYPSVYEIERILKKEIIKIYNSILQKNEVSYYNTILRIFECLITQKKLINEDPFQIYSRIKDTLFYLNKSPPDIHKQRELYQIMQNLTTIDDKEEFSNCPKLTASILKIYEEFIKRSSRDLKKLISPIENYINSVNYFLIGKKLRISSDLDKAIFVNFGSEKKYDFKVLSSGERQIISLLYASTTIGNDSNIILVDEPEVSLHVDWQRNLIKKMQEQLGSKQMIFCTHSPEVAQDHLEMLQQIQLKQV
jgi:ABC-type lipoprotein export system ATPase subunit